MAQRDDKASIEAVIEVYRSGFLDVDPAKLKSIWDTAGEPLVYVAQERDEAIRGWPAIERYLSELPTHLTSIEGMEIENLAMALLGDVALACFDFRSQVTMRAGVTASPTGRVSMALRRRGLAWRLIHYHESARAAPPVFAPIPGR